MKKSSGDLAKYLQHLARSARALGLTAAQWAARAGIRPETLSRLHRRSSCDLATLQALAQALGFEVRLVAADATDSLGERAEVRTCNGLFPSSWTRDAEESLVELSASRVLEPETWAHSGPRFFMAGVAVMLASVAGFDRRRLLELAEALHAGSSTVEVFAMWLTGSPLQPSRFLPMVQQRLRHVA